MNKPLLSTILFLATLLHAAAQTNVVNDDVYTGKADITATNQVRLLPGFRAVEGCDVRVFIDPSASYTPVVYNPTPGGMPGTVSPSGTRNYIRTTALRQEQTNEANIGSSPRTETVDYFDGLGRPVQSIAVQASPDNFDIVAAMQYDGYGRDSIHYLPYISGTTTGAYVSNPETGCANFYSGAVPGRESGTSPWNETLYEQSPLNRVTGGKGPDDWQTKPTAVEYLTNTTAVDNWTASGTPATYTENDFAASQLYVTQYTDEDGNQIREFKDKLGRVVCKASKNGANWLETHYIYDDFGLLRCVVPPKASGPADAELCYYYEYDERRRMTKKDLPGAAPVYMVYDKRDRLVMTQDGNLDVKNRWLATIYDNLNRPVLTAFINTSATPATVETVFSGVVNNATFNTSGSFFGYNVSLPSGYTLTKANVLTATYYDNYSFTGITDFNGNYGFGSYNLAGFTEPQSAKTKGLVTGTFTRALENTDDAVAEPLLVTTTYYDDYARPIRIVADNHLGKTDVVYTNYNFAGEITETTTIHNHGQSNQVKLATNFKYDHQGRLLSEKMKINGGTEITLASYKYNELGEQIAKYLHGSSSGSDFNQKVDYKYNIKGWLRTLNTINDLGTDLFALDLRYNTPGSGDALTASARHNGKISEMRWDTGTPKGYGFTYDGLSRLTAADYADGSSFTSNQNRYNTSYGYDANGNISTLSRYLNATQIDNLTYTYASNSNQIASVNDATGNSKGYDDNNGTYTYDNNGNLGYDPSKGTYLDYNYLNLPEQVQFGANDNLRYTYDAAGNKLVKVVDGTVAGNNTRLDYSGNFLYENGELKAIFTSAGRIIPFDNGGETVFKFEYNLQDHLGNTRVVFSGHSNGQPELMQVTDYYPFGMVMNQENYFASGVLSNKYLYNNKELQDDELAGNSLGWYDYGARFYDPELGRWHSLDPLAQEYNIVSPYTYCLNNPIIFVDPDGKKVKIKIFSAEAHAGSYPLFSNTNEDKGLALSRWFGKGKDDYGNFIVKAAQNFGEHGKDGVVFGFDIGVSFMYLTDKNSKSLDQFLESEPSTNVAAAPFEFAFGEGKFGIGIGASLGVGSSESNTLTAFYLAYTDQDTDGIKGNIYSYSIEDGKLVFHVKQGDKNLSKVTTDIEPIEGKNGQYKTPNYIKNEKEEEE
jgi:RHS repeat-associated protein